MGERDFIWWERLYSTSCHKLNLSASWCLTLSTSWLSQNQNQTRHEGFLVIAQQRLKKFGITSRSSRQLQQNSHLSFFRSYPKNISSRFVTLFSCFSSRRRHRESERDDGVSGSGVVAGGEAELRIRSEVDVDMVAKRGARSEGSDSRRYGGVPGRSESE